jgi:hypothetical protein
VRLPREPLDWLFLAVVIAGGIVSLLLWDIFPLVLSMLVANAVTFPARLKQWNRAGRPDGPMMKWWDRLPGPSKDPNDYR